jgi:cytochrome c oxidase assembly protein subunit 15
VTLDRLGFPAVVQPAHLLLANLIFGMQFLMLMICRFAEDDAAAPTIGWATTDER